MLKSAIGRYGVALLLILAIAAASPVRANEEPAPEPQAAAEPGKKEGKGVVSVDVGKAVYEKRCLGCHGVTGAGDGPAAERFKPRPRDFTRGLFKYKTTAHGSVPVDDDLVKVVTKGLPGTGMPAWGGILKEHEIRSVVQYIKTFAPQFADAPKMVTIGPEVKTSQESVQKGKDIFNSVGCMMCHGDEGRGNGPLAPTLKDSWGRHVQPRNLTKGWTFRSGNAPKDIYTRINTGLMGTPMPSFATTLDNEKSWHVANYVNSLSQYPGQPDWKVAVVAKPIVGEVADDPEDPRWAPLEQHSFPLVGQVTIDPRMFTPTVDMVTVKAMYNEKEFSLLVIWDDPTKSVPAPSSGEAVPEIFDDAVAIQFPAKMKEGNEKPYFIMGDPAHPVYVARWNGKSNSIDEFNAKGTEVKVGLRITPQEEPHWQFKGKGVYKSGQYKAVFKRPLQTEDKEIDLQIEPGKFYPIAFTAWDGSNGEHDAQRSLSAWYSILLEVPPSKDRYIYPTLFLLAVVGMEWWISRSYRKGNGNGNGNGNGKEK
jgi:DMSO reductase family type II enzyme heme b subunit